MVTGGGMEAPRALATVPPASRAGAPLGWATAAPVARPSAPPPGEGLLASHYARADRILGLAVALHLAFGLALAPVYGTWVEATLIGGVAAAAFFVTRHFAQGTFLSRAVAGTTLQVFCAQYIYQLHGLAEMHFFFFTSFAIMIVYLDWVAMWPGALLIIGQHLAFALLHNAGVELYFFEDRYVGAVKLAFHFGIAATHVGICGYWAHLMRGRALHDASENARLDRLVDERTAELALLLDNVDQGFVKVGPDGRIGAHRSRALEQWFGPPPADGSFARWVGADDASFAAWFALGLEGTFDGFLPPELALEQMPTALERGGRTYTLGYRANGAREGRPGGFVVVIVTDVTETRAREAAEQRHGELVTAYHKLMTDRAGFAQFVRETDELVRARDADSLASEGLKRRLHTLKGNASLFGLVSLARQCHALEDVLASTGEPPAPAALDALASRWAALRADFVGALEEGAGDRVEIDRGEFEAFASALRGGRPRGELVATALAWTQEPARHPLGRLRGHALAVAARLGKEHVRVRVEAEGVRAPGEAWAPFWSSLVHVVRNAIDHGVEAEDERGRAGKPREAEVRLRAAYEQEGLVVEVRDDGRGIDWDGLAARARARGLEVPPERASTELLLAEGVSTREEVTELSGRGVGFGAAAEAARRLGGVLEVQSTAGQGTVVRFVFPASAFQGAAPVVPSA